MASIKFSKEDTAEFVNFLNIMQNLTKMVHFVIKPNSFQLYGLSNIARIEATYRVEKFPVYRCDKELETTHDIKMLCDGLKQFDLGKSIGLHINLEKELIFCGSEK